MKVFKKFEYLYRKENGALRRFTGEVLGRTHVFSANEGIISNPVILFMK